MDGMAVLFCQWLSVLALPPGTPQALRAACRVLLPLAVILWGIGLAVTSWPPVRALAVAATVSLVTVWTGAVRHTAERRALLHAIAELSGRGDPPTGPLRAVS